MDDISEILETAVGVEGATVLPSPSPKTPVGNIIKLDSKTSSAIRKAQIVTKISDVVRELVENSVDSGATSVQVLLEKFGLDKIEVKDNGHGMLREDLNNVVIGGYTSKLEIMEHSSCQNQYGFRGEALSSICASANVCITTKTQADPQAKRYILDENSKVVSEAITSYGNGTIVTAENIFQKYPVRRQWLQNKNRCAAELREVENILKSIAIANPKVHMRLFHNSNLIWNKAAVSNVEQAVMTVLGHEIASNLKKCGPEKVVLPNGGNSSESESIIEAFFLKKKIDMKKMSYTTNKTTYFFVNRKRVVIREFEKLLQRYTAAAIEKPSPAERRRFPIAIVCIDVPSIEVDFNRDVDKSKVFLVNKEPIASLLEKMLGTFYEVTSSDLARTDSEVLANSEETVELTNRCSTSTSNTSVLQEICLDGRRNAIESFLSEIPTACAENFKSPLPSTTRSPMKHKNDGNLLAARTLTSLEEKKCGEIAMNCGKPYCVANFDLNLDEIWTDTPPEKEKPEVEILDEKNNHNGVGVKQGIDFNQWINGRVPSANGGVISNVTVVNDRSPQALLNPNSAANSTSELLNAFSLIGSGLSKIAEPNHPAPKRRRIKSNSDSGDQPQASGNGLSMNAGKQVTLDHFKNWGTRTTSQDIACSSPATSFEQPVLPQNVARSKTSQRRSNGSSGTTSRRLSNLFTPDKERPSVFQPEISKFNRIDRLAAEMPASQNSGKIINALSDTTFYAAIINDIIGIFHPMNMLHEFPSLRIDLNVTFLNLPNRTGIELYNQYTVDKVSTRCLFLEFLRLTDAACESYPKIFHKLDSVKDLFNRMESSRANLWH